MPKSIWDSFKMEVENSDFVKATKNGNTDQNTNNDNTTSENAPKFPIKTILLISGVIVGAIILNQLLKKKA